MKNTRNPQMIQLQLSRCIDRIGQLNMEAMVGIDCLANQCDELSDLVFCNELASSLDLMQAQVEYYFPAGEAEFDLDEWAEGLAVLNSGADFFEDQVIELEARFDESDLAECFESLSLTHIEAIPYLIAARLAHDPDPEPVQPHRSRTSHQPGSSWAAQLLATT